MTELIYRLVKSSHCIFLARLRRFGKSLLLSTIQAYFEGKRELFRGLAIEHLEKDWQPHVVLTISLAKFHAGEDDSLEDILDNQFIVWEKQYNGEIKSDNLAIEKRNYARQFAGDPRPVIKIGVTFSSEERNTTAWQSVV